MIIIIIITITITIVKDVEMEILDIPHAPEHACAAAAVCPEACDPEAEDPKRVQSHSSPCCRFSANDADFESSIPPFGLPNHFCDNGYPRHVDFHSSPSPVG